MIIKQPTPILRKPRVIFLFDGFTVTADCARVACNGFSGTGGTVAVAVGCVAAAAFISVAAGVGMGVTAGVGAGGGDGIDGITGVGACGSTGAPQA